MVSVGILITAYKQAEIYIPSTNETFDLPEIPGNPRLWHTLTGNIICGGVFPDTSNNCLELTESGDGWIDYSTPFEPGRMAHSAWQSPDGDIVLMGGYLGPTTSDFVTSIDTRSAFAMNSSTR